MARITIADKRARLFKEWMLACYGNHANYYYSTIVLGVPDGDDEETVLSDLKDGFYDKDIDETLDVYERAKKRYAKHGWFVNDKVVYNEETALVLIEEELHIEFPTKIYKG